MDLFGCNSIAREKGKQVLRKRLRKCVSLKKIMMTSIVS